MRKVERQEDIRFCLRMINEHRQSLNGFRHRIEIAERHITTELMSINALKQKLLELGWDE
jgi:hypothetical protein